MQSDKKTANLRCICLDTDKLSESCPRLTASTGRLSLVSVPKTSSSPTSKLWVWSHTHPHPNSHPNRGNDVFINPGTPTSLTSPKTEDLQFYYHPDHLGSSNYITDASGEVYQHQEYFPFGETFVEERNDAEYTKYLFNGKELDEETGLYYYGARYYDPKTGIWQSVDQKAEKYRRWSPYVYCMDNPILFVDPNGNDVIILIWGTGDGSRGVGHAAIAIQNYKTITERIKVNGRWTNQTKQVFDGTYTVRDLWPGVPADKNNFYKDLPAAYSPMSKGNRYTLDQLKNTDITNGSEGRPADGLIQLKTTYLQDKAINVNLDLDEKDSKTYNGVKHNCSDYVESALDFLFGNTLPSTDEKATETISVTTPNQIYKAAKAIPGAKVLKDAGKETAGSSLEAATGGRVAKAAHKAE